MAPSFLSCTYNSRSNIALPDEVKAVVIVFISLYNNVSCNKLTLCNNKLLFGATVNV